MSSRKRDKQTNRQERIEAVPWVVVYYLTQEGTAPALDFLDSCPGSIDAQFIAVLDAVAAAPPPRFSGGGKWEAMHGVMSGWYEIRLTGPMREQFRLFCLLENRACEELAKRGLPSPALAVIAGMRKRWRTMFSDADYKYVRSLGDDYQGRYPRSIAA